MRKHKWKWLPNTIITATTLNWNMCINKTGWWLMLVVFNVWLPFNLRLSQWNIYIRNSHILSIEFTLVVAEYSMLYHSRLLSSVDSVFVICADFTISPNSISFASFYILHLHLHMQLVIWNIACRLTNFVVYLFFATFLVAQIWKLKRFHFLSPNSNITEITHPMANFRIVRIFNR